MEQRVNVVGIAFLFEADVSSEGPHGLIAGGSSRPDAVEATDFTETVDP